VGSDVARLVDSGAVARRQGNGYLVQRGCCGEAEAYLVQSRLFLHMQLFILTSRCCYCRLMS
jgi:hypothetical protein